jgi:hypothetical protein
MYEMKVSTSKNLKVVSLVLIAIKFIISFLYIVFFKYSTPSDQIDDAKISPMLANKGEIALLLIGDEIDMELLRNELNEKGVYPKISQTYGEDGDLDVLNKRYPLLEIEKKPAYFVFDSKGIIYKSYKYDDFVKFLKEYSY